MPPQIGSELRAQLDPFQSQMVMDEDGEGRSGGGQVTAEDEEISSVVLSPQEATNVVQEVAGIIESVAVIEDYRRTQRKECYNLVRRMKLLLPLLEEIRDLEGPIPEVGVSYLCNLQKALLLAKKLLRTCSEGSKLYLVLESEAILGRFHATYDKISQVLDDFPFDELGISDEVKEQIELLRVQLKRAKRRTETQDLELAMDIMVVLSKDDERNADSAIIERLAKKLELQTVQDLKTEAHSVRKIVRERGQTAESAQQIIGLLNKFNQIAGVGEANLLDNNPTMPKALAKSPSLFIPHEFLCPITLEIMTDPVIVATGQTYERESIQKWLDSNHRTCPKTRQALAHLSLAPNFALKNLILQWCEKNKFQLPKKNDSAALESSCPKQKEEISSLVENLSSIHLGVQRQAVMKIRLLSKENPENRILIASTRGIPPLVQLLSYPDSKIQEHSVTALLNLSIDESNKKLIAKEGAIPAIIEVLQRGTIEAKENSAAAIFSLSMLDEIKVAIAFSNGIPPLVELLKSGTIRGKKDAATALFNLSLNHGNKARAIEAGIVAPLLKLVESKNLGMVDEALSILLLLASHPDGRHQIGDLAFIETLVELMRDGTPKNKECATAVLLELGSNNSSFMLAALQFGVFEHLTEIARSGTNRAQRKANSLLQLMSKCEQIP